MRIIIVFWFIFLILQGHSQDLSCIDSIQELQVQEFEGIYQKGLFPCQRIRKHGEIVVEDNNIFFTGLTLYTLNYIKDSLSQNDQLHIENMYAKAYNTFNDYKNRKGGFTYNFYQIHPGEHPFPNATHFQNAEYRKIADDFDDTSVLYLIQDSDDSLNAAVKAKMETHSLMGLYTSTFKQFRNAHVYKTWFSQKMNQDIDICVQSNVLLFIFEKQLPLTSIDSTTINVIKSAIRQNLHKNKGHLISAHYQNTTIILYHIARLIAVADSPLLNDIKSEVISDIYSELSVIENDMEKVILLTSLYRLGENVDFELDVQNVQKDMQTFYWFQANPFYGMRFWIRRIIGGSDFLQEKYRCEAYYWTLVFELQVMSSASVRLQNQEVFLLKK